ncbi:glycosyltransferase family 2 protein [Flavobacterium eburneipallidum]|uniref:glycosyltransferase family 2 protein n=1 Tax=Flavobacterium eburneipallidum TaxID=3003263 RepID=UPI002482A3EE|nr:glycosyltransferase [Flavobacterium eburneipallidum]
MDSIVNSMPKITVLMPVYNCELYIREAVDSILNQTFTDFEFLIIDDASADKTVELIKTYSDERIKLVVKPSNTGYTNSLNYGVQVAKGEYIARMDGDDISLPERFAKQVAFLDANPDVILCGSWFSKIDSGAIIKVPENYDSIKLALLKGNCMAHPSVMMRKQVLDELSIPYDVSKEPAEDYDLWVRLVGIGRIYNLQEVLLNYREHHTQVSQKRRHQQIASALSSRFLMLQNLKYSFANDEIDLLKKIIGGSLNITITEIEEFIILKQKMILANSNHFFETKGFDEYLKDLQKQSFKNYFVHRERFFPSMYFQYFARRNKLDFKLHFIDELKLMVKSIIFYKKK